MLPIQSLLNPVPPDASPRCSHLPNPAYASPPAPDQPAVSASRAAMDARQTASGLPPLSSRTQGPVRYPPYEEVDAKAFGELIKYQISTFGRIGQCCEHIPYNSSKKNFYEKTGRESIEAFKYEFRLPGEEVTYTIMWDYNIGLVRMTPFFKCLGYPKPSQMLDKNPGLREISPSITGGSVSAQGYWMPYRCARAICATFCHRIAGALIPLFGSGFIRECTPPENDFFAAMVIDQNLIVEARADAETQRRDYESKREAALRVPERLGGGPMIGHLGRGQPRLSLPPHRPSLAVPRPAAAAGYDAHLDGGIRIRDAAGPTGGLAPTRHRRHGSRASISVPAGSRWTGEPPPLRYQRAHAFQIADPWRRQAPAEGSGTSTKRPRPDQGDEDEEYEEDVKVRARLGPRMRMPRMEIGFAPRHRRRHEVGDEGEEEEAEEGGEEGQEGSAERRQRDDYDAAAVLVRLQTTVPDGAAVHDLRNI